MTRLPQPGSDDGTWGTILNEFLSVSHNTDGTLLDNLITSTQLNTALNTKIDAKADTSAVAANYMPLKNGVSSLTDSTSDKLMRINITDDGSFTPNWPDRFAFYFNGVRTGYHNEYGEIRARPAKSNTVPLRAMGFMGGSSGDVFQVTSDAGPDSGIKYFGVGASGASLTVPLTNTSTIDAPNLVKKSETHTSIADTTISQTVNLTYPIVSTNPDLLNVYTARGDGQANFRASWVNEWGALRGTSPYQGYGDALVRAIRTDQDIVGTGGSATKSNAVELVDRRTGANGNVMWGRSWVDGHLTRNGIAMADSIVLNVGDPVPVGLPAGTIIIRI